MALTQSQGQPSDNQGNDFAGASTPNSIGYRFIDLDPSTNIYIQRDDRLVIQWMSSIAGDIINVGIRLLLPGRTVGRTQPDPSSVDNKLGDSPYGVILPINQALATPTAFVVQQQTIDLAEGYLLSLVMSSVSGLSRGSTFVKAFIVRGNTGVANAAYMLCADYASNNNPVGFPFGRVISPTEGNGIVHHIGVTAPAAGADWTFLPQANTRVRVISTQARLTCSAAVANRNVSLVVHDNLGGNDVGTFPVNLALVATNVGTVSSGSSITPSALIPALVSTSLPESLILCNSGSGIQRLSSLTQNIQAADQWTLIELHVEQWLDF